MKITRTARIWELEADREPDDEWENVNIATAARPHWVCPDRIRLSWTSYDFGPAHTRAWIAGPRVLKDGSHSGHHDVEVSPRAPGWLAELAAAHMPDLLRTSGSKRS